ncbi:Uncharacterised protein [Segatella copri]|nr:Uncharacterised protein [Segatella copri]
MALPYTLYILVRWQPNCSASHTVVLPCLFNSSLMISPIKGIAFTLSFILFQLCYMLTYSYIGCKSSISVSN